jgi:hypothetical protein
MYHITFMVFWPYSLWTTKVNTNMYVSSLFVHTSSFDVNLFCVLYLLCAHVEMRGLAGLIGPCSNVYVRDFRAQLSVSLL